MKDKRLGSLINKKKLINAFVKIGVFMGGRVAENLLGGAYKKKLDEVYQYISRIFLFFEKM